MLEKKSYQQANEMSKRRFGIGTSAQSYALRHKIREVDQTASTDDRFFSVHPEVTFWMLAGFKKTWDGITSRRFLLERAGVSLPDDLGLAGQVPVDDILEAANLCPICAGQQSAQLSAVTRSITSPKLTTGRVSAQPMSITGASTSSI